MFQDIFAPDAERYDRWFDQHAVAYESEVEAVRGCLFYPKTLTVD